MKTKTIDVEDARDHLSELLSEVTAGTQIILTEGSTPKARLVPIEGKGVQRIAGLHAGTAVMSSDFDDPLPDDFWAP